MLNIHLYANGIGSQNRNTILRYAPNQIFGGGQRNAFLPADSTTALGMHEVKSLGAG
jgi:hypothetical protein